MKKYAFLIMTAVIMFSMAISAQQPNSPQGNNGERKMVSAQMRAERLAKQLNLTDEQKAKVQAVYEKNDVDFAKLRDEVKKDDPSFKTKMKEFRERQDAEIKAAIGDEKYAELQKLNEERRQKMKETNNTNSN